MHCLHYIYFGYYEYMLYKASIRLLWYDQWANKANNFKMVHTKWRFDKYNEKDFRSRSSLVRTSTEHMTEPEQFQFAKGGEQNSSSGLEGIDMPGFSGFSFTESSSTTSKNVLKPVRYSTISWIGQSAADEKHLEEVEQFVDSILSLFRPFTWSKLRC